MDNMDGWSSKMSMKWIKIAQQRCCGKKEKNKKKETKGRKKVVG